MAQVPQALAQDAAYASEETHLSQKVIEAWWIAENGWDVPNGYNFGNIRYDPNYTNSSYYQGMVGTTPAGFVVYDNAQDGINAFSNFLKQPNYNNIRWTAGASDGAQIQAIAQSPWDSGHYGGDGSSLAAVYNSIDGGGSMAGGNLVGPPIPGTAEWQVAENKQAGASGGFISQIAQMESMQSYNDWAAANKRGGSLDVGAPLAYLADQSGHMGFRIIMVLVGLLLVIFGLVVIVKDSGMSGGNMPPVIPV